MSLDVYLEYEGAQNLSDSEHVIPIREDGRMRLISHEEWGMRFPGLQPVTVKLPDDTNTVYHANITHNLNTMADEAGVYRHLWRPEELGIEKAGDLIEPLKKGLEVLRNDPARFQEFNPSNGWGNYEGLVEFVEEYLAACIQYQDASIYISR